MTNIATDKATLNSESVKKFYADILGLDVLMDLGWLMTMGNTSTSAVQLSLAIEGGSGTPVPDISIEVDDVEAVYQKMNQAGFEIDYPLTEEPWGMKRFFVLDPLGKRINIAQHM